MDALEEWLQQQENSEITSAGREPIASPTQTPWYQLSQDEHCIQSTLSSPCSSSATHCLNAFITHV
jgi:hypothetical protein